MFNVKEVLLSSTKLQLHTETPLWVIQQQQQQQTHTFSGVDSSWTECFPHNCLTNVCGNEKGNTRSETVAFLEELVQQQDNQTGNEKLHKTIINNKLKSFV